MTVHEDPIRAAAASGIAPHRAPELGPDQAPDLVALAGSRMAHDLNNPIGAIANGVELLGLTGQAEGPELALITESVENARRRIKGFRIAFGAAAPGQTVSAEDIRALTAPGPDGRRIEIDWPVTGPVPRQEAKAVFLALMCLESALAWGGRVAVRAASDGWRIVASAERMRVDPGLWHILEGGPVPADLPPNAVHFALFARELAKRPRPVAITGSDTAIEIGF
ncbi:MAG: histidine phosphotransferase family protein [Paracoccaceae bacterium]|nr:histidine phosphotransferase [Maritimibacter sp.]